MQITGYDYIFYAPLSPKKFLKCFRKQIKKSIWQNYLEDDDYDQQQTQIVAYFQKNQAMNLFSDHHGYALNSDGEGPFAIFTSKKKHQVYSLARNLKSTVDEEIDDDECSLATVYICPKIYRYTLVLPADIDIDPFSKRVHDCAFESLIQK